MVSFVANQQRRGLLVLQFALDAIALLFLVATTGLFWVAIASLFFPFPVSSDLLLTLFGWGFAGTIVAGFLTGWLRDHVAEVR